MPDPALDENSSTISSSQALLVAVALQGAEPPQMHPFLQAQPWERAFETHSPKGAVWSKEELQAFPASGGGPLQYQ